MKKVKKIQKNLKPIFLEECLGIIITDVPLHEGISHHGGNQHPLARAKHEIERIEQLAKNTK